MDRRSIESAFRIEPPVSGVFEWSGDSRHFVYRHDIPFDIAADYTVRILGNAQDLEGVTLDGRR